jgi:hypothetical protein
MLDLFKDLSLCRSILHLSEAKRKRFSREIRAEASKQDCGCKIIFTKFGALMHDKFDSLIVNQNPSFGGGFGNSFDLNGFAAIMLPSHAVIDQSVCATR